MSIVDWIFPKYCAGCGREGKYICDKCAKSVRMRGETLAYEGNVRKIIKEIKFRGSYEMIKELIDLWEIKTGVWKIEGGVVAAVPMWGLKKRIRGFNQAELIARELARRWKVQYVELLARIRETKPMYGLNKQERKENVKGAFQINIPNTDVINIHKCILVDDIWTTGSTLRECEKVLIHAGIKQVIKVVIAS